MKLTGGKSDHGGDPVHELEKPKEVYVHIPEGVHVNQEKPAANLTGEKSGRDDGPGAIYADVYKYGKLRRVQDQEKVAVGEKTGSGDGPVYEYGKWREVHAGESYVNRGKAVNFTGEKFDHGDDTICKLGKMKKVRVATLIISDIYSMHRLMQMQYIMFIGCVLRELHFIPISRLIHVTVCIAMGLLDGAYGLYTCIPCCSVSPHTFTCMYSVYT